MGQRFFCFAKGEASNYCVCPKLRTVIKNPANRKKLTQTINTISMRRIDFFVLAVFFAISNNRSLVVFFTVSTHQKLICSSRKPLPAYQTHTTACVCLRAKDGAAWQLELQGELVRKMVSIQEEILRKLEQVNSQTLIACVLLVVNEFTVQ